MPAIIESLRKDHRNFELLLKVLEQELAVFNRAERPDYEILEDIIAYFQGYPERCHHPKEDVILGKVKARDPTTAEAIGDLETEHEEEARRLLRFTEAVARVFNDHDVPRDAFDKTARDFIEHLRRHMEMEEQQFFSAALKTLTDEDWAELDAKLTDEKDPLFAGEIEEDLTALRHRILKWVQEDQGQRTLAD